MDPRATTARYYDLEPEFPQDLPFYIAQLPSPFTTVLELGCGTGRITVPLAAQTSYIHGIDLSHAMVSRCAERLRLAGYDPDRAVATLGDISNLCLNRRFDLVVAPYRVFQNLATDVAIEGFFATVRAHLAPGGTCILNTFHPYADPATILAKWQEAAEDLEWERTDAGDVIRCYVRRGHVQADPLVLYPELIYRRYRAAQVVEEARSRIAMRCWYPADLQGRIRAAGFRVREAWGGYSGEPYGQGPELVVAMTEA